MPSEIDDIYADIEERKQVAAAKRDRCAFRDDYFTLPAEFDNFTDWVHWLQTELHTANLRIKELEKSRGKTTKED